MSNGSELKGKGAEALRAAGYVPLPRWWVTKEQLDLIEYMVGDNAAEVNRIRTEAKAADHQIEDRPPLTREQERELAWRKHRRSE